MAARATCANLISRVRVLIGDADELQFFTDAEIQTALDSRCIRVHRERLEALPDYSPTEVIYQNFYHKLTDWEEAVTIKSRNHETLTLSDADYARGYFTLEAQDELPPVYISGYSFDIYGAAHDLLLSWASALALEHDFSLDGQTFHASQKEIRKRQLAREYAKKTRPRFQPWGRGDING